MKPLYSPMTHLDRRAAKAISPARVTYLPGSYDKRFAAAMELEAAKADAMITDAQRNLLWSKVIRYRRQLRPEDRDLLAVAMDRAKKDCGNVGDHIPGSALVRAYCAECREPIRVSTIRVQNWCRDCDPGRRPMQVRR